ncbi:MAG: glycosyltransferase family 39 protein [Nocardioides sp.]
MLQQRGKALTWPPVARVRRLDWWGPTLALVGIVIFLLHGFGGLLTRDLALYAYGGQQFAEGVPPYVGVLNRAGPLAHMVPGFGAMIARVLGTDDLLTMRVLMMALSVVAVWLTYLLGRDAFRSRLAGVAAAVTLLTFQGFVTYATGGPREKTTMMLLVVCVLLAVVHRRWAWAGAAVALATLTWQPAFVVGTIAVVAAVLVGLPGRKKIVGLLWFTVGGVLATAAMISYFVAVDELDAFFEGFLFLNATSTRQMGLIEYLGYAPAALAGGFGWSWGLILGGLLATVVLAVRAWRGGEREEPAGAALIATGAATLAYLVWSLYVFNGWADAVVVLPLAALGLGGLLHMAASWFDAATATRIVAAYAVVALVATGVDTWLTRPDELGPMRAETEAMLAAAGPRVTVLSVGAPQPLVFGQLKNPLQHQMFIGGLGEYLDETWPGGLEAMAAVARRDKPTYITMDHPEWYGWLRPVLLEHYREIGTTLDFTWYVERSVGEEQISRLTAILDSGP